MFITPDSIRLFLSFDFRLIPNQSVLGILYSVLCQRSGLGRPISPSYRGPQRTPTKCIRWGERSVRREFL